MALKTINPTKQSARRYLTSESNHVGRNRSTTRIKMGSKWKLNKSPHMNEAYLNGSGRELVTLSARSEATSYTSCLPTKLPSPRDSTWRKKSKSTSSSQCSCAHQNQESSNGQNNITNFMDGLASASCYFISGWAFLTTNDGISSLKSRSWKGSSKECMDCMSVSDDDVAH